jgi:4-diphosphocytidyl-2-C-methyl-D-erythritol kinase
MRRVKLRSLAKINLDLRVLNKRADGFHELRTVFQTISLADTIEIEYEPARRRAVTIEDSLNLPGNLIVKAAHAMLDAMHVSASVKFKLMKNIPLGGGLGGGSSNAAAVLLALPVLAGREIPMERLQWMALELGSDVPFFLFGGTRIGLGRGGEMYPQADVHDRPILLVLPNVPVATGPAYAGLDRSLTFPGTSSSINSFQAYVSALGEGRDAVAASSFSANDFEAAVFKQHPQLGKIAARLRKFSPAVRMSGSGSTLFAMFSSEEERRRAVAGLSSDGGLNKVMKGCRMIEAALVSRRGYQRLWRRQLAGHLVPFKEDTWPPRSKHMGHNAR